jgi:CheY-like chemotaxis protein
MDSHRSFDIFRKVAHGEPSWLESCPSLEAALERAREAASSAPGEYFVFDRQGQKFIDASAVSAVRIQTRALVADDHEIVRKSVCELLRALGTVEIVAVVSNGRQAVEEARKLQPDLVIMDWSMPELDGLAAAQMIKRFSPNTAVVMFSVYTGKIFADSAKIMGLDGFVAKEGGSQTLLSAVDAVQHHQKYFPA